MAKAILLSSCGSAAFSLIETLVAPADVEDEAITFDIIQTTVLDHLRPKQILHYERHQLHSLFQNTDSISTYLQRLKDQANRCQFGELREDLILSQFIFGLSSQDVRTKLLSTTELSLNAAVQMATLSETVSSAACHSSPATDSSAAVSVVTTTPLSSFERRNSTQRFAVRSKGGKFTCYSCGNEGHIRADCQYRRATCKKCGRQGHISKACRSTISSALTAALDETSSYTDNSNCESNSVVLAISSRIGDLWHESCQVGDAMISFLIDTGSQVTLLPMQLAKSTGLLISPASSQVVRAYGGGGRVHLLGKIQEAKITLNNNTSSGEILVTHDDSKPILGMDFLPNLRLVKECAPPVMCIVRLHSQLPSKIWLQH